MPFKTFQALRFDDSSSIEILLKNTAILTYEIYISNELKVYLHKRSSILIFNKNYHNSLYTVYTRNNYNNASLKGDPEGAE